MTYNFTDIIDRHGMDALAVDGIGSPSPMSPDAPQDGFTPIPMWVADMNFATVPTIPQAIIERAKHPLYGYFSPSDEYFDSVIAWHTRYKHAQGLEAKHIVYENGVLGGVLATLNVLASRGDSVLVHAPTYIGFEHSLTNAGFSIVHSPMHVDGGLFRIDYDAMEQLIVAHDIHVLVFCNPHNPTGRVWTKDEILRLVAVCEKHDVWIVSDEIWSDIILDGEHTPTQSVSEWAREHTAAFYAPSKTFNLAGLVGAYGIIYNDWLRDRVVSEGSKVIYNAMNVLWEHAVIGAYSPEGAQWVREMRDAVRNNIDYAYLHIEQSYPGVQVCKPQGTYMLLLDCREYCEQHGLSLRDLLQAGWAVGVGWQDAEPFQVPFGIRMNLALPMSLVKEAFTRLDTYVFNR
ncbi:MAG: aminotransferase class I/II-fold pyridoxal phosphate-dependent enzyme [Actinomycetaceae bacterium]|nr:aminotransferase class I/II-fold pyridoxal phosphate-dependent enzyme [Actinomycetaceae bacterium]MDY6082379.1 aminotransferase class I/II-fold pyridoxal phosphate-dependent enzyme [Actinomycetaceae bacterium]